MRTSRFTEEQIIGIVREHEAGAKLMELCRRHNVSPATFYKWRAKYGGGGGPPAQRPPAPRGGEPPPQPPPGRPPPRKSALQGFLAKKRGKPPRRGGARGRA